jgi:large subunit ribosomal protein L6
LSRIGKLPIPIPQGVEVEKKGSVITVKGQHGALEQKIHRDMDVIVEEGKVLVKRPGDGRFHRALHGLTRTLINNMILGVRTGYEKTLEIVGVGFRAELKGKTLVLQIGFSHPIYFVPPDGITLVLPNPNRVVVKGIDRQLVGQVAAKIRFFRPPESYKGKGIRYEGEYVRKKAGKATA